MRPGKATAAAQAEVEAAQQGLRSALATLGSSAGDAKLETTAKAKRIAPIALGVAGAAIVAKLLLRRR